MTVVVETIRRDLRTLEPGNRDRLDAEDELPEPLAKTLFAWKNATYMGQVLEVL